MVYHELGRPAQRAFMTPRQLVEILSMMGTGAIVAVGSTVDYVSKEFAVTKRIVKENETRVKRIASARGFVFTALRALLLEVACSFQFVPKNAASHSSQATL